MKTNDLMKIAPPWIGQFVADHDTTSTALWKFRGEATKTDLFIGTLRGSRMRRREGVFEQFGALLQFPHYFGENWNAFADCIRDLDWLHASGFVLVILDAVEVLADGDSDEFALLLKMADEAGASWGQADAFRPGRPFHVLLHATDGQEVALRIRLAGLGLEIPTVTFPQG